MAAIGLFRVHDIIFLWRIKAYQDVGLLGLAFFSTLIFGVELGIVLTIMVSIILVARHTSKPFLSKYNLLLLLTAF
jgi:MFS superfamily sulfate permease-like transporter